MKRVHATLACDPCRRRKSRCIAPDVGNICRNCERLNRTCVWTKERRPRGPKPRSEPDPKAETSPSPPKKRAGSPIESEETSDAGHDYMPEAADTSEVDHKDYMLGAADTSEADHNDYMPDAWPPSANPSLASLPADPPPLGFADAASLDGNSIIGLLNVDETLWSEITLGDSSSCDSDWMWNLLAPANPGSDISLSLGTPHSLSASLSAPSPLISHHLDDIALARHVDTYCNASHCILPTVDRSSVLDRLARGQHHTEQRFLALLYSMAALSETISDTSWPPHRRTRPTGAQECASVAQRNFINPGRSADFTIEDIATALNLNFVHGGFGDRASAWYWMQEALSIAQALMIDDWGCDAARDVHTGVLRLKTYYVLVMCERASALFDSKMVMGSSQGLRIPGNAYEMTRRFRETLPAGALDGFPLLHARLLSIISPEVVACWRGRCEKEDTVCRRWCVASAVQMQRRLGREAASVMQLDKTCEHVKLAITTMWIQDRFWNICRTHGLVQRDHALPELSLELIVDNLARCSDYCATVRNQEYFTAYDLCIKISDLVMTAISIVGSKEAWLRGSNPEGLRVTFRPLIDRFIGLLLSFDRGPLAMELVQAAERVH